MSSWHAIPGLSRLIASSSGSQPAPRLPNRSASNSRAGDHIRSNPLSPSTGLARLNETIDQVIDDHPDFFGRPYRPSSGVLPPLEDLDREVRVRESRIDSPIGQRYDATDHRRFGDDIEREWARQYLHGSGDDLRSRRSRHIESEDRLARRPRNYYVEDVWPERLRPRYAEERSPDRPRRNAVDFGRIQPVHNNAPRAPRPGGEFRSEQVHVRAREQGYISFERFPNQPREQEHDHSEDRRLAHLFLTVPAVQEAEELFAIGQPGPSTYIRRPAPRDCAVCGETKPLTDFHERPPTMSCQHAVQTCQECLQRWIASEFQSKGCNGIICSECPAVLTHDDVRRVASPAVFVQFDRLSARNAMSQIEDFAWCLRPGCGSGQVNYQMDYHNRNFMLCDSCRFQQCLRHRTAWHWNQTCEEIDAQASALSNCAGDEESAAWVRSRTKPCPNPSCGVRIEKADGCDHMTCRRCRLQFCWQCMVSCETIRRMGNSAHKDYCPYHNDDATMGWPFNYH